MPHQDKPLILEVSSPSPLLAVRAAYILAYYTNGKIKSEAQEEYEAPEHFVGKLGEDFDLQQAMAHFREALKRDIG